MKLAFSLENKLWFYVSMSARLGAKSFCKGMLIHFIYFYIYFGGGGGEIEGLLHPIWKQSAERPSTWNHCLVELSCEFNHCTLWEFSNTVCSTYISINHYSFQTSSVQPLLNWGMISLRWPVISNNKEVLLYMLWWYLRRSITSSRGMQKLNPGKSA